MKTRHFASIAMFLCLLAVAPLNGQTTDAPLDGFVTESHARIGSLLTVVLTNVPADHAAALNKTGNLVLNLRGVPFPNLCTNISWSNSNSAQLQFLLAFNSSNRLQWAQVLQNHIQIPVTVGVDNVQLNCGSNFSLVAMDTIEKFLAGTLLLLFGYVSFFLATRTEMVRDPAPPTTVLPDGIAPAPVAPAAVVPPAAPVAPDAPGAAAPALARVAPAAPVVPPAAPRGAAALLCAESNERDKGRTNALVCAVPLVAAAVALDRLDSVWSDIAVQLLTWIFVGATVWWFLWHFNTYWKKTKNAAAALNPYSLARVQMAVWFFLIVCSWVFLWLLTGTFNTLTNTVLALMGIGAGTALGAEVQDAGKPTTAENLVSQIKTIQAKAAQNAAVPIELQQLNSLKTQLAQETHSEPPATEGFFDDMITDSDGISFHRFQMFVWTVVLGIVFVVQVCQQLAMPEFDATLLDLMGISSGTYLGFMIKEPHSSVKS